MKVSNKVPSSYQEFPFVTNILRPALYKIIKQSIQNKKVLDLGCGAGACCSLFADNAKEIYGLDSDEIQINLAKKNFKMAKFFVCDATNLNQMKKILRSKKFDYVISHLVICNLPSQQHVRNYIINAHYFLNKGGTLILSNMNLQKKNKKKCVSCTHSKKPGLGSPFKIQIKKENEEYSEQWINYHYPKKYLEKVMRETGFKTSARHLIKNKGYYILQGKKK